MTALKSRKAFALPYILFMLLFVILPLVIILLYAFMVPDRDGVWHFTFRNFGRIFGGDLPFFAVLGRSLYVGLFNSLLCLLIGYPIAYFLSSKKYNKSSVAYMLFILPMWMNFLLRTVATKNLFDGLGVELGGMGPVMFGMVYNFLPFMILPIYNVLSKMDKNLLEAAVDLGANDRQVFLKAVVPLSAPGIVSGILMVFMPTISTYVITDFLSNGKIALLGNLIDIVASGTALDSLNVGCALSVVMLLLIGATVLLSNKFDKLGDSKGEGLW